MGQLQHQPRQIGALDFCWGERLQSPLLAARPEAVAGTLGDATRTARALGDFGLGDALGHQTGHARGWIEARPASAARVDHHADVLNGQRGFGDRRGQHDLAARRGRLDRGALGGKVHGPEKRAHDAAIWQAAIQQPLDAADLAFAGQEDQYAAFGFFDRLNDQIGSGLGDAGFGAKGTVQPAGFHRIAAAFGGDHRRVHQGRHRLCVQGRGHSHQHQVVP